MMSNPQIGPGSDFFSKEERNEALIKDYKDGMKPYELSDKYDICHDFVHRILRGLDCYDG